MQITDLTEYQLYPLLAADCSREWFQEYVVMLMKHGDAAAACFLRGC